MHKVMALDIGTKRIGIALSDFLQVIAVPHSYISRQPEKKAIEEIYQIANDNHVEKIIIGLPKNMDDSIGAQAQDCIDFSQKIFGFDIILEDERLTSEEAESRLRERKINFRKNKGLVDMESAAVILEQYLSRR